MPALCWHSTPAYYAFYYAGIFDTGLPASLPFWSSPDTVNLGLKLFKMAGNLAVGYLHGGCSGR